MTELRKKFQTELEVEWAKGFAEGFAEGMSNMLKVGMFLYTNGREEEIPRICSDREYYKTILNEIQNTHAMDGFMGVQ